MRPCTRVTVYEIVDWLVAGASENEIFRDYPYLEPDDFRALSA